MFLKDDKVASSGFRGCHGKFKELVRVPGTPSVKDQGGLASDSAKFFPFPPF